MHLNGFGISLVVLAAALAPQAAVANAQSHSFGPHTKAQIFAICDGAAGQRTTGPAQWGCKTLRWQIACVSNGKSCTIDLFGLSPNGGSGAGHMVTTMTTTTPPQGNGLSGNGGIAGVGGQMGGGTIGHHS